MADVLLVLVVVLITWAAIAVGLGWFALRRASRANRISPRVPSPAPLRWRWSPSASALLHRRLQAAAFVVDPARGGDGLVDAVGTDELRAGVVEAAVRTDAQLAALRHAPSRVRRAERGPLTRRVAVIEDVCARLHERPAPRPPVRAIVARSSIPADGDLVALVERMHHLETGRAEVRRWVGDRSSVA